MIACKELQQIAIDNNLNRPKLNPKPTPSSSFINFNDSILVLGAVTVLDSPLTIKDPDSSGKNQKSSNFEMESWTPVVQVS